MKFNHTRSLLVLAIGMCASVGLFAQSNYQLEKSPKAGTAGSYAVQKAALQEEAPAARSAASKGDALYAEMLANQGNAAYDMAQSIARLRQMGYYYPLAQFDPRFQPVFLTGDKIADKEAMKLAWKAYQSNTN